MTPLFYLAEPKLGGWVTFIAHLVPSLRACGLEPQLFRISKKTESKPRPFTDALSYYNVDLTTAIQLARRRSIVVAAALKPEYLEHSRLLCSAGAALVVHGAGQTPEKEWFYSAGKFKTVAVRRAIAGLVHSYGLEAQYIPHPYQQKNPQEQERTIKAVALSRLDWVKKTEIIVEANEIIQSKEDKVKIYGMENTQYTYNKLREKFPNWKENYYGKLKCGEACSVLSKTKYLVDMTQIAGDGGGTQYTFLEAFDSGSALILNKKWLDYKDTNLIDEVNVLSAENGTELCSVLNSTEEKRAAVSLRAKEILLEHDHKAIGERYKAFLSL